MRTYSESISVELIRSSHTRICQQLLICGAFLNSEFTAILQCSAMLRRITRYVYDKEAKTHAVLLTTNSSIAPKPYTIFIFVYTSNLDLVPSQMAILTPRQHNYLALIFLETIIYMPNILPSAQEYVRRKETWENRYRMDNGRYETKNFSFKCNLHSLSALHETWSEFER